MVVLELKGGSFAADEQLNNNYVEIELRAVEWYIL